MYPQASINRREGNKKLPALKGAGNKKSRGNPACLAFRNYLEIREKPLFEKGFTRYWNR
jgi:hypothetical protein